MMISGKARLAGVLGWPVAHSISPRLHGYWLQRYGIDGAYVPLPVRPDRFADAVRCLRDLGFRGANVTLPYKEEVVRLCDEVSGAGQRIGAVNMLVFREGRILGDNSDAFGFLENLRQGAPDWWAAEAPAVVLGAGGAVRAVVVALLEAEVPSIRLVNRTRGRADALAERFGAKVEVVRWEEREAALAGAGLLVNGTSLGMEGQPELALSLEELPVEALVTDLVYKPLDTELLRRARARGNATVDGLGMLINQARPGFAAWFGREPEVDQDLRRLLLAY